MSRFCGTNVFRIIVVFICVTIDSTIGQQSKISIFPPKEPEFFDEDHDNIRGLGGKDYPIYAVIPKTSFTCNGNLPGFYADEEAECQVFHLCNNNHKISFLCGNGTIFNQKLFTCNWWYNTTCSESHKYYSLNAELYKAKNDSKQLTKSDNKNANFESNRKVLPQKINRLPQPIHQIQNRIPQEVVRQSAGPQVVHKPQLDMTNDPVVRHLVFADNADTKEPETEEIDPEEYDSVQDKSENAYEMS